MADKKADETAVTEPKPVLEIDTLVRRPVIAIDGQDYEILSHDELSVVQSHMLAAKGKRISALAGKTSLADKDKKKLLDLLHELTNEIMVGVPAEIRDKLTDAHRMKVAEVFTKLPLKDQLMRLAKAGAAIEEMAKAGKKPTGAKPRRGSKGSTAGRRSGGSTKRRSPSSGPTTT